MSSHARLPLAGTCRHSPASSSHSSHDRIVSSTRQPSRLSSSPACPTCPGFRHKIVSVIDHHERGQALLPKTGKQGARGLKKPTSVLYATTPRSVGTNMRKLNEIKAVLRVHRKYLYRLKDMSGREPHRQQWGLSPSASRKLAATWGTPALPQEPLVCARRCCGRLDVLFNRIRPGSMFISAKRGESVSQSIGPRFFSG